MKMATLDYSVVDLEEAQSSLQQLGGVLADLPEGKAVRISIEGKTPYNLYSQVYQRANRLGINLSVRRDGEYLFIFRKKERQGRRSPLRPMAERDEQIVKAVNAMRSYADIAQQFGVTRQRVEQIYVRQYPKYTTLPVNQRTAAFMEFMAPYLAVDLSAKCFSCGTELTDTTIMCDPCRKTRYLLATIKSRLRQYAAKSGETYLQALHNAAQEIRKHGILPEDLRFV